MAEMLSLRHVVLPDFPGLSQEEVDEQMAPLAGEVFPRLGFDLTGAS